MSDLSLPLLAGILKHCDAYLGNDSGISHLAGACGIPLLVLFGPTDPTIWRPLSNLTWVLSFQEATVGKVVSSLKQLIVSRKESTGEMKD
jgi:ADP-heptose:LPS heptosyltransferase